MSQENFLTAVINLEVSRSLTNETAVMGISHRSSTTYIGNTEIRIVKAITFTKQSHIMDAIPGTPSIQWYTITNTYSMV